MTDVEYKQFWFNPHKYLVAALAPFVILVDSLNYHTAEITLLPENPHFFSEQKYVSLLHACREKLENTKPEDK